MMLSVFQVLIGHLHVFFRELAPWIIIPFTEYMTYVIFENHHSGYSSSLMCNELFCYFSSFSRVSLHWWMLLCCVEIYVSCDYQLLFINSWDCFCGTGILFVKSFASPHGWFQAFHCDLQFIFTLMQDKCVCGNPVFPEWFIRGSILSNVFLTTLSMYPEYFPFLLVVSFTSPVSYCSCYHETGF